MLVLFVCIVYVLYVWGLNTCTYIHILIHIGFFMYICVCMCMYVYVFWTPKPVCESIQTHTGNTYTYIQDKTEIRTKCRHIKHTYWHFPYGSGLSFLKYIHDTYTYWFQFICVCMCMYVYVCVCMSHINWFMCCLYVYVCVCIVCMSMYYVFICDLSVCMA